MMLDLRAMRVVAIAFALAANAMSKTMLSVVAVTACSLTFSVAAWVVPMVRVGDRPAEVVEHVAAQPKAEAQPTKWEYCELTQYLDLPLNKPKWRCTLRTPQKTYHDSSSSFADITKAIGGEAKEGDAIEVLNILGNEGWELVAHNQYIWNDYTRNVWVLKRPSRK